MPSSFWGHEGDRNNGPPKRPQQRISELELETLVDRSTERVQRTNSGSQLVSRPNRTIPADTCENRSQRIARVAFTKSRSVARRVFRPPYRASLPYALLALLGMVVVSICINGFEGSYVTELFGSVEEKHVKESHAEPKETTEKEHLLSNAKITTTTGVKSITTISQPPTVSPTLQVPEISIHEHKQTLANNSEMHLSNSFSSWLDFSNSDPPPKDKIPPPMSSDKFVSKWCDVERTTWFPEKNDWRVRAPSFLLPGAAFSGTVYMASVLHEHPSIAPARAMELNFFLDRQFKRYVNVNTEKTLVWHARERMYANQFFDQNALQHDPKLLSFDASPSYLFYSTLTPRRIMCVEPWIKLVLLLRNPVDRVLEHYTYMKQKYKIKDSLEEIIDQDMALMSKIGLLNGTLTKKMEDEAWLDYQSLSKSGILGRGIYVIQVRHWVQALRYVGRNPATEILMIRTDSLAANPTAEYNRILQFLHLAPHALSHLPPKSITHQTRQVSTTTRQRLEDFYRPFNTRFKEMMREHGLKAE